MHIRINGFLPAPNSDSSLKFEAEIPQDQSDAIVHIMNWDSIDSGSAGEYKATKEQVLRISELLNDSSILALAIYVSTAD